MTTDVTELLVAGPWEHRFVAANGARFHVTEAGTGPLVVLLHGFPQFWWSWRHQLPALAAAGYRAVAMDLRGYGGSDKPPRGYDTATSAADVAGVVRALGAQRAVVVGHDWGGWVAWSMPAYAPTVTRAVAAVSMGHPLEMRAMLRSGSGRGTGSGLALRQALALQVPMVPERRLASGSGVSQVLRAGGGPGYPDAETEQRYRHAMRVPFVAHTSVEYLRWALRSVARQDGRRFARAVGAAIEVPVLTLRGTLDDVVSAAAVQASARRVRAPVTHHDVAGAGHFLPEEAPDAVTGHLLSWLAGLDDD